MRMRSFCSKGIRCGISGTVEPLGRMTRRVPSMLVVVAAGSSSEGYDGVTNADIAGL